MHSCLLYPFLGRIGHKRRLLSVLLCTVFRDWCHWAFWIGSVLLLLQSKLGAAFSVCLFFLFSFNFSVYLGNDGPPKVTFLRRSLVSAHLSCVHYSVQNAASLWLRGWDKNHIVNTTKKTSHTHKSKFYLFCLVEKSRMYECANIFHFRTLTAGHKYIQVFAHWRLQLSTVVMS